MGSDFAYKNQPNHWELATLGDIVRRDGGSIQTGPFGSQLHAADYVEIGIPSVMPKNISIEGIVDSDIARITTEDAKRLSKYLLKEGDIVYSRRGDVEKCALVKTTESGWLCGTGCLRIRLGQTSIITAEFLHAYLSTPAIREWVSRNAVGATMPNLNTSILAGVPVYLPSITEIKFFGDTWSGINKKITLNREINQTLEQMAQTLFKSWFVDFDPVIDNALDAGFFDAATNSELGSLPPTLIARAELRKTARASDDFQALPDHIRQLFPSAFEDSQEPSVGVNGWVPTGWEMKELNQYGQIICGKTPLKKNIDYYGSDVPLLKIPDMHRKVFALSTTDSLSIAGHDSQPKKLIPKNSICVSSIATVGLVSITGIGMHTNQQINSIVPYHNEYRDFLYFSMLEKYSHFHDLASGGSATLNMNTSTFSRIKVLYSSAQILDEYQQNSSHFLEKIRSNDIETSILEKLRDTLLPKLISGELRLDSPEVEKAKALVDAE